jgi:ubiquinone/menaquinone biosynthesis C-methylase UbiE
MPAETKRKQTTNIDEATVRGFGKEWSTFTQTEMADAERVALFESYFSLVDWTRRPKLAMDFGCGSGRWSVMVAPLVDRLVAVDASSDALEVARKTVKAPNVTFERATPDTLTVPDSQFDLIFSLGVLHHLPDTEGAIRSLSRKLCPGGTLLLYLYYSFENRPLWFRVFWKITDLGRRMISRLPFPLRYAVSQVIAALVYWPLARTAKLFPVPDSWPLRLYSNRSFYVMRTDALDRFGTRLEKRFTRGRIIAMLESAGLREITFSQTGAQWVCTAKRR